MNLDGLLSDALLAVRCAEIAETTAAPPALDEHAPLRKFTVIKHVVRDPESKKIAEVVEQHVEQPPDDLVRRYRARFRAKDPTRPVTKLGPASLLGEWRGELYEISAPVSLAKNWNAHIPPGTFIPETNILYPILDEMGALTPTPPPAAERRQLSDDLARALEELEDCHARPDVIRQVAVALKAARRPSARRVATP